MQWRNLAAMHLAVCHDSVMAASSVEGGRTHMNQYGDGFFSRTYLWGQWTWHCHVSLLSDGKFDCFTDRAEKAKWKS